MTVDPSVAWEAVEELVRDFLSLLPNIAVAMIVFVAFLVAGGMVRRTVRAAAERAGVAENAATVVSRLARWGVIAAGLLAAISIVAPSVGVEELIGLLGVSGIAIGFAFRDILQNFLAGILLLIQQPFRVGDQIETSDGYVGTVEEIQTRATLLKTFDGRRVVIPNENLYTDAVEVRTAYPERRSELDIGIGYPDDVDLAAGRIMETLREVDGVLEDPAPEVLSLVDLGDSSVSLRARWWTRSDQGTVTRTRAAVADRVKRALDDAGVDIPYPIRTVLFHDETARTGAGGAEPAA